MSDFTSLPIAVRVYPKPENGDDNEATTVRRSHKTWRRPDAMFVFDTETRIDATQRLTFGSYRYVQQGECLEEGLFYADDLPETDKNILLRYVAEHEATARNRKLLLLSLAEFVDKLYWAVYKGRCLMVCFNLPFDLSRIAFDCAAARGRFAGGFSLGLWRWKNQRNQHRPRVGIKHIDGKRSLKGFPCVAGRDQNCCSREKEAFNCRTEFDSGGSGGRRLDL